MFGLNKLIHLVRDLEQRIRDLTTCTTENLRRVARAIQELESSLQAQLERVAKNMVTREEYDASVALLKQAVVDASHRVVTDIQALRDQLARGVPITDADLAAIQGLTVDVGLIDPPVVVPG